MFNYFLIIMHNQRIEKYQVYKNDLPDEFQTNATILAIDTETMGLNPKRDRLCTVQFCTGDNRAHIVHFDGTDYSAPNLKKLLTNPDTVMLFHYARFDVYAIKEYLNICLGNLYCTKIASRLARTYSSHHSLKALVQEIVGMKMDKFQQSSDWGCAQLSQAQIDYAAGDVIYLHAIKRRLDEMLKRSGRYELAMDCFAFLPIRSELDELGWNDFDIFQHSDNFN